MNLDKFISQLPQMYHDWGSPFMSPQDEKFAGQNFPALLNLAVSCLSEDEIYCHIGGLRRDNLIGAFLDGPEKLGYAVDNFTKNDSSGQGMSLLSQEIIDFGLEEQILISDQSTEDFFLDLKTLDSQDRIGVYCYDGLPKYREVLMALLLAIPFWSESALIIVSNCDNPEVQQAVEDFCLTQERIQIVLDWRLSKHGVLGLRDICVLSWQTTPVETGIHSGKKLVLNVGCGPYNPEAIPIIFRGEDWQEIRLDINMGVKPDLLGTITDLQAVENDSIDAVFSSHNLEHIYPHEVPIALEEFKRVLKPGGMVMITLPDIQKVAAYVAEGNLEEVLYESPAGPISAIDVLYGLRSAIAMGNVYMAHNTAFTADTLKQKLEDAGFEGVEVRSEWLNLWATGLKNYLR